MRRALLAISVVFLLLPAPVGLVEAQCLRIGGCLPLGASDRAKLIGYVQEKYKVPPTMQLKVTELSFLGDTGYRKLRFQTEGSGRQFRLDLYASPDLRFLSRDLMDATVDPLVEEREKQKALAAGLTNGAFPALGPLKAPVTLTVFSDFECPYCAQLASMLKDDVLPAEGAQVRVVYRYFPLPMHPWARPAAEAAACAEEQSNVAFWELHDFMFQHQKELTPENLRQKLLEETKGFANFDQAKFESCVAGKAAAANVDQDVTFALDNGISATPTVFVNGVQTRVTAPEQLLTLIRQIAEAAENIGARQ